jgi:quercetin dioxygenase-like cupin family protein
VGHPRGMSFETALNALLAAKTPDRAGHLAVVERPGRRSEMTPLHLHPEDEIVHVLEGEMTLVVGEERVELAVGDVYAAPRATPHALVVESARARYVSATVVRSAARYEDFLRAVTVPAPGSHERWEEGGDGARVAALAAANGIEVIAGPHAVAVHGRERPDD